MATRRRCIECRRTFTPGPRAVGTQLVCGPACRAVRDRKLARARRQKDVDGFRDDERLRQQASRAVRAATMLMASQIRGLLTLTSPPRSAA
jgi:hypothetical protein